MGIPAARSRVPPRIGRSAQLLQLRLDHRGGDPQTLQAPYGARVLITYEGKQEVLRPEVVVAEAHGLAQRLLERFAAAAENGRRALAPLPTTAWSAVSGSPRALSALA